MQERWGTGKKIVHFLINLDIGMLSAICKDAYCETNGRTLYWKRVRFYFIALKKALNTERKYINFILCASYCMIRA